MTCTRCGAELWEHPERGPISPNGRPTCPRGGPHRLPGLTDRDLERLLAGE